MQLFKSHRVEHFQPRQVIFWKGEQENCFDFFLRVQFVLKNHSEFCNVVRPIFAEQEERKYKNQRHFFFQRVRNNFCASDWQRLHVLEVESFSDSTFRNNWQCKLQGIFHRREVVFRIYRRRMARESTQGKVETEGVEEIKIYSAPRNFIDNAPAEKSFQKRRDKCGNFFIKPVLKFQAFRISREHDARAN